MPIPQQWAPHVQKRANQFLALYRYFMWSASLADLSQQFIKKHDDAKSSGTELSRDDKFRSTAYLSYWFASLYVLTEGWEKLGLRDASVDELLTDTDKVETLRHFRHGVYHFMGDWKAPVFTEFQTSHDVVGWAMRLGVAYADFMSPHQDAIQVDLIRDWLFAPSKRGK